MTTSLLHGTHRWIPSVYFLQGVPFAFVTAVSPILYKAYGWNNRDIAFLTSLLTLPWVGKFIFAPLLENLSSKRRFILLTQATMAGLMLLLAWSMTAFHTLLFSSSVLICMAIASAMHDINVDGLYLEALDANTQAKYIGMRTVFYQLGKLACQGGMIYCMGLFVGKLPTHLIWPIGSSLLAVMIFGMVFYNNKWIPNKHIMIQKPSIPLTQYRWSTYSDVFHTLRQLPHRTSILLFILLYNFPESQLIKILPLFMLDPSSQGGLQFSLSDVGMIYGGISIISMLIGVTASGFLLRRFTLKKCLIPFTLLTALGNISYVFLPVSPSFWQVGLCVIIAQCLFGLSNGAYMLYLVTIFSKKQFSMSLYAMATAIMLLGMTLGGGSAGYIQSLLGYTGFFIWVVLASMGVVLIAIKNVRNTL